MSVDKLIEGFYNQHLLIDCLILGKKGMSSRILMSAYAL